MGFYKIKIVPQQKGDAYVIKGIVTHYFMGLLKTKIEVVELDGNYNSKYCRGYNEKNKQKPIPFEEAVLITLQ